MNHDFIIKELKHCVGGGEETKMYAVTNVAKGKTEVVIEHTIKMRMPIQELEKADDIYEKLTGGNGRRIIVIEDILEMQVQ